MALSLVPIFVIEDWKLPGQWTVTVAVIAIVTTTWTVSALRHALSKLSASQREISRLEAEAQPHAPKVVYATSNPTGENELILLLEPNRLFGQSMLVSIYYEDERGFEQLVAAGRVANVQTNGKIQIGVTSWVPAQDELRRHISGQDASRLARLLVRPAPTTEITGVHPDEDRIIQLVLASLRRSADHGERY
jgi:hypothetical protein